MPRRRTKKRTHLGAQNGPTNPNATPASQARNPKSMVLRIGASEVGPSVTQLVKDVRTMMEPDTASRLKERKSNRLKDYITMAGPLNVSHLLLFSRSPSGNTNMRIALTPRGPTLHFKVEQYSLCKDIKKSMKHPVGGGKEYLKAPLLVMNNFLSPQSDPSSKPSVPKHLETLATSVFQSLFPAISPQATPLTSIRRVLLLNRELDNASVDDSARSQLSEGAYTINLRHYAIITKSVGLSKGIRRINAAEKLASSKETKKKPLPDLGRLEDVADYLMDPSAAGYTSASETEIETDAEVEVLENSSRRILDEKKRLHRRADAATEDRSTRPGVEKRAVKMVELGPRMKLRMTKVEEGVCAGKVMWHEYIHKTKEEIKEMDKLWETRRREKEARRREQKENIEAKRKARGESGKDDEEGGEEYNGEYDDLMDEDLLDDDEDQAYGDDEVGGEAEEEAMEE